MVQIRPRFNGPGGLKESLEPRICGCTAARLCAIAAYGNQFSGRYMPCHKWTAFKFKELPEAKEVAQEVLPLSSRAKQI